MTGVITGTVFDPQNAAVPNAKVTATNLATNTRQTAYSTAVGAYTLAALPPAAYRLTAEAPGFNTLVREPVVLAASGTVTVDMTLTIGETITQVTVTSETPLMQTATSEVRYAIKPESIADLPLPNQNVLYTLNTIPGVIGVPMGLGSGSGSQPGAELTLWSQNYVTPGSGIMISGGTLGSTQYQADGISNNSTFFGRIGLNFGADTIQEVSIVEGTFSAEYGRTRGGIVNMVTKSGTNELHGTVFSFSQHDKLNAGPYNKTNIKQLSRYWRGGVTAGGPVWIPKIYNGKNRTFFFVSVEPMRQRSNSSFLQHMPTDLEEQGDFSQSIYNTGQGNYPVTIFRQWEFGSTGTLTNIPIVPPAGQPYPQWTGNKIPPQFISPIATKLLKYLPAPNLPLNTAGQNFTSPMTVKNIDNRYMFKIDQSVTSKNRLSVRYAWDGQTGTRWWWGGPSDPLVADNTFGTNAALTDTHTLTNNIVNEFRLGYLRTNVQRVQGPEASSANWFSEVGLPSIRKTGFPGISIGGYQPLGAGGPTYQIDNNYQLTDNLSWFHGRHHFKMGFELLAPQSNITDYSSVRGSWGFSAGLTGIGTGVNTLTYPGIGIAGASTGNGVATMLLGYPDSVSVASNTIPYQYRWKNYAGFFQDNLKVTPNLTLNIGVRYQVEVARSEKHHNQGWYRDIPTKTSSGASVVGALQLSGLGGAPNTFFPTRYNNWEPRIGLAYRIPHRRFTPAVVRAAYGITHVPTSDMFRVATPNLNPPTSSLASSGGRDGGWVQIDRNPAVLPKPMPAWPSNGLFSDLLYVSGLVQDPGKITIPYVQQWNFTLGFELAPKWALEVQYVGSKGTNLFGRPTYTNLEDQAQYTSQFLQKVNLTQQIPNPYGALGINGTVATIPRGNLTRPNPLLGAIANPFAQGYNSNYNALNLLLTKGFSNGFQLNVSYTFSKNITESDCYGQFCNDGISDFGNGSTQLFNGRRALERSVSTADVPHNFRFSGSWQLPFGNGKAMLGSAHGVLNAIVGNWRLSGVGSIQSGQPWQVRQGTNPGLPSDYGTIRPDLVLGVEPMNPVWPNINGALTPAPYLNFKLFSPAPRFSMGTAPRTLPWIRMPGIFTFDMSFLKDFPIHDKIRLEFRGEMFDIFNHVNFFGNINNFNLYSSLDYANYVIPPSTNYSASYSTTASNTYPNRTMQLGLKLYF